MKEKIYKICTQLNDGQIAVTQATELLLDLFAVRTSTFRFSGMANGVKFVINVQAPNRESAIAYFESEHPKLKWRTTTEITDVS
jgi:phage tail tube protein FII